MFKYPCIHVTQNIWNYQLKADIHLYSWVIQQIHDKRFNYYAWTFNIFGFHLFCNNKNIGDEQI